MGSPFLRVRIAAVSSSGPVVGPVHRLRLESCPVRRPYMGFIESVTVAVVSFAAIDAVASSSVQFSSKAFTV